MGGKPAAGGVDVPPIPTPPGIDRGAPAVVKETLTPDKHIAVELPPRKGAVVPVEAPDQEPMVGPLVAPAPAQQPRRYYFVIGVSPRGRKAPASPPLTKRPMATMGL